MSTKGSIEANSAPTSGESKSPFAYCKIFPGIGVARVGNSPEEYFVGPEVPGVAPLPDEGKFKDAVGRIKRQAARFRIYAFDAEDNVVAELTSDRPDVARIEWTVSLANKKASWHRFQGAQRVANIMTNTEPIPDLRNRDIEGTDRERLNIVAPEASITCINKSF